MAELVFCARGCTSACHADECLASGVHDHPPPRRRARVGLLCDRCSERLLDAVRSIPDLWATLPSIYDTSPADDGFGERVNRGKVTGSPALIRLDIMVLLGEAEQMPGDGVMPVEQSLGGWLRIVEEELGLRAQSETVVGWCELLRQRHRQICRQQWVDEYASDLLAMHRALRMACRAPGPIGRCRGWIRNRPHGGCGRLLYAPGPGEARIVCPNERCGRTYTGPQIVELALAVEREGVV